MPRTSAEVLYTSGEILSRLKALFAEPKKDDRRVAIVAYVGDGALHYLASPKGMHLICNPSAGGTSPHALRRLIQLKATVQLSANLHAKVYWSEQRGCIIGSANASTNALGVGGLKEAAVFLPPGTVDIDKLIAEAAPQDVTEKALLKLQKGTNALPPRFRGTANPDPGNAPEPMDFRGWFEQPHRDSDPWKLGYWLATDIKPARSALTKVKQEYGVDTIPGFMCAASGTTQNGDWLLTFHAPVDEVKIIAWMFIDFVVPVSPSDEAAFSKEYPFQAIQVHSLKHCPRPPFKITPAFRKAFARAVREHGLEDLAECSTRSLVPPTELLDSTYTLMSE
ncbi:MAG: phospholipase D family protein [Lamprocystis purpurea]|jgi:hypothetical protein|uniref:phospholipase D family protein n=1 Tax=Lamprocystis purpurea TaxID=61598 RepID=UPI0003A4E3B7|nr:phospholipase D family protein [Lamprocystis purpurea]MBV5274344.1 phospholipase D family protein [Lamprocystis purpurea]